MKTFILMTFVLLGMMQTHEQCDKNEKPSANVMMPEPTKTPTKFNRLPEGIALNTEVEGKAIKNDEGEIISYEITTVEKRLTELKAKYEGKLVDDNGREIRFFNPLCRGVSQGFEEDRRAREIGKRACRTQEELYGDNFALRLAKVSVKPNRQRSRQASKIRQPI